MNGFAIHADFLPTVLSLVGALIPPEVDVKGPTPLLIGAAEKVRNHAVLECRGNTSMITDRWRLGIFPDDGDGELYDLQKDPDELHNLYNDSEYGEVRVKLMGDLQKFHDGPYLLAERWREDKKEQDEYQADRYKESESWPGTPWPRLPSEAVRLRPF